MSESLFSPSWYRVNKLKPRLRGHTRIHRHDYRGEVWCVLQDHAKGRYYRFTPSAYHVIGEMDGERTVQDLWDRASDRLGDDGPTQGEIVQLLSQLHSADVLLCDVPPDTAELLRRSEKITRTKRRMSMRSPLALRFPLLDPERFLARTIAYVRPLFSVWGAVLWLLVVGAAIVQAALHWPELTRDVVDRVLSVQNLLIMGLAYPIVKALHELGHGYAVKAWGGEVHEMGIMLLVLMPIPYVDASAASEFREKHRRVIVGAAGIFVEMFLAALALLLWAELEPGNLRALLYNVILIGGVSTLLFNGNPLLRFDGYYIFADLVEIPNLAQRGTAYLGYLIKRYPFGMKKTQVPYTGPGERFWFVTYTIAAVIYRMFIYVAIVLFIAGKFFVIGILLAIWAASSMVLMPLFKGLKFVAASPILRDKRARAVLFSGVGVGLLALILFLMPFPSWSRTEGVVWVPEESIVRAGGDGFVSRLAAAPDSRVTRGQILIERRDPFLAANVRVLQARLEELQSRYDEAKAEDKVRVQVVREELDNVRASLARAEERLAELDIRSPVDGVLVVPRAVDLPDRFVRQGEPVAYVLDVQRPTIRVVVPQADVDLVRQRTRRVDVRLVERLDQVLPAVVKREVPEAGDRLPSTILGMAGGGKIAIDPTDDGATMTFEKHFQFDLELVDPLDRVFIGSRVYVRFDHGFEPIAFQVYRNVRQLFLRRFNV
jgi:putative peptide zinc metalloprotease protein